VCCVGNGYEIVKSVEGQADFRWDYRTSREFVQRKRYSIDIPDWARFSLEVLFLLCY
jgi:hypothetical protein